MSPNVPEKKYIFCPVHKYHLLCSKKRLVKRSKTTNDIIGYDFLYTCTYCKKDYINKKTPTKAVQIAGNSIQSISEEDYCIDDLMRFSDSHNITDIEKMFLSIEEKIYKEQYEEAIKFYNKFHLYEKTNTLVDLQKKLEINSAKLCELNFDFETAENIYKKYGMLYELSALAKLERDYYSTKVDELFNEKNMMMLYIIAKNIAPNMTSSH